MARPPLPELHFENVAFWTGGRDGTLLVYRCASCGLWLHPPRPACRRCRGTDVAPQAVAGTGSVVTYTVNHQAWTPGMEVPYVLAVVELDEQLGLRVATRLVDVDEEAVRVGLRVRVVFEQVDDVWLPLFAPGGEGDVPGASAPEERRRDHRRTAGRAPDLRAVVSGAGQSAVGRRLGRSPLSLTVEAAAAAVADAGLTHDDIDGISTWPGAASQPAGFSGVGVWEVQDALGLSLDWFSGGSETAGQLGAVFNACAAVSAGLATHVLCFRTVWEATAQTPERRASIIGAGDARVGGGLHHYLIPLGAMSAANWTALLARRHFHEHGTTREQLAAIALNARANATRNPAAVYREPLTMEDYLASRMISDPLCLYDCDVPVDGSTAIIVSAASASASASSGAGRALRVAAIGGAVRDRPSWDQYDDLTSMAARDAAAAMWATTDLRPADVDVALLYDGFSWLTLAWLEALGFCGRGESGAFVEGGKRIALEGELPLNPHGGQLSGGRLHGFGFLHEAVVQLRGGAGQRQVQPVPEVAAVAAGGGPLGGCLLLTPA